VESSLEATLTRLERKVDRVLRFLIHTTIMEIEMTGELDALATQVKANTDVEASALQLIQGIQARLDAAIAAASAAGATPAQLAQLTTETAALKTSADALASAVAASTPAA
jgi:hypothetical protein